MKTFTPRDFRPAYRGLWLGLYALATLALVTAVFAAGWYAYRQVQAGLGFPWWTVTAGAALLPLPMLLYGLLVLWKARYRLDARGLHVFWGRDRHTLPWPELTWAGLLQDYPASVEIPPTWWPGLRQGVGLTQDARPVRAFALQGGREVFVETETLGWLLTPARPATFLREVAKWVEAEAEAEAEHRPLQADTSPPRPEASTAPPAPLEEPKPPPAPVLAEIPAPVTAMPAPVEIAPVPTAKPTLAGEGAWWQNLLQDRLLTGLLLGQLLLGGLMLLLWWLLHTQGHPRAPNLAYVLTALSWLTGMSLGLGFYAYGLGGRRTQVQALWLGQTLLLALFVGWLAFHALF